MNYLPADYEYTGDIQVIKLHKRKPIKVIELLAKLRSIARNRITKPVRRDVTLTFAQAGVQGTGRGETRWIFDSYPASKRRQSYFLAVCSIGTRAQSEQEGRDDTFRRLGALWNKGSIKFLSIRRRGGSRDSRVRLCCGFPLECTPFAGVEGGSKDLSRRTLNAQEGE